MQGPTARQAALIEVFASTSFTQPHRGCELAEISAPTVFHLARVRNSLESVGEHSTLLSFGHRIIPGCTSHREQRRSRLGDSVDSESGATRYFSFTKSNTKIAHTPTVMGNCAREASRSVPPLGRMYVAAIIARAVSTARISLFQFMRVGLPFPFGTSTMAAIVHVFPPGRGFEFPWASGSLTEMQVTLASLYWFQIG